MGKISQKSAGYSHCMYVIVHSSVHHFPHKTVLWLCSSHQKLCFNSLANSCVLVCACVYVCMCIWRWIAAHCYVCMYVCVHACVCVWRWIAAHCYLCLFQILKCVKFMLGYNDISCYTLSSLSLLHHFLFAIMLAWLASSLPCTHSLTCYSLVDLRLLCYV